MWRHRRDYSWTACSGMSGAMVWMRRETIEAISFQAIRTPKVMPALFVDEQRQQSLLGDAGHGPLVLVDAARLAGEYKNLEIVFADLEQIGSHKSFEVFEAEYLQARARLEKANAERTPHQSGASGGLGKRLWQGNTVW